MVVAARDFQISLPGVEPAELLQAARPILEEWHAKQEKEAAERWREESGRGAGR